MTIETEKLNELTLAELIRLQRTLTNELTQRIAGKPRKRKERSKPDWMTQIPSTDAFC